MRYAIPLLVLALASCAVTSPTERELTYDVDGTPCVGFLALADGEGQKPGVLVVHEWWGHNDYARTRARMLADLGYNALAVDMYGEGRNTDHPKDAQAFMREATSDLDAMVARFRAAYDVLRAEETTDPDRIAAIGYCFGGGVVLHMARIGTDLDGVVSFHGSLTPFVDVERGALAASILVCHGAEDQLIPPEQARAFREEMRAAGADLEFVSYEGAWHAFTNPGATAIGETHGLPLRYDAEADRESWAKMQEFLARVLR